MKRTTGHQNLMNVADSLSDFGGGKQKHCGLIGPMCSFLIQRISLSLPLEELPVVVVI